MTDTSGTTETQLTGFDNRIARLTTHLQAHPSDYSSRRGLLKLIGRRRRLRRYHAKHST